MSTTEILAGPIGKTLAEISSLGLTLDEELAAKVLWHMTNNVDDAPHLNFPPMLAIIVRGLEDE